MYRFARHLMQPFPLLMILAGVALVHLWLRRRESRGRLLLAAIPVLLLAVLSIPAVAYFALGSLEWRYPPLYDRPADARAIVVLAGYVRPPDEMRPRVELAEDTLGRCVCAAELYRGGEPCLVVVSGGVVGPGAPGPTLAEAMSQFMLGQGVAAADLLKEEQSQSTYENALQTAKLLRERGIDRIVLVTDASHMMRSERCFQAQGLHVVPAGCRYRATRYRWTSADFVPSPQAAVDTYQVVHEWLGLLWYWLKGRA